MTTPATVEELPRKALHAAETASAEAREQADEYDSLFGHNEIVLENGDVLKVPPHPDYGMLDDEQMQAYDELMYRMDTEYEREDDVYIPEQRLRDATTGQENGVVLPGQTTKGRIKTPFRIKNADGTSALVQPPHTVKVVQVALGDAAYQRLKDGGRNAADVWRVWNKQSVKIRERAQRDSKSNLGNVGVAPVPPSDS